MEIHIEKRQEVGSCNYCDRSEVKADGMGLDYPYEEVVHVKGNQISTRFCFDCFKKLKNFNKFIK